VVYVKGWT
jgi:hypothetical protein